MGVSHHGFAWLHVGGGIAIISNQSPGRLSLYNACWVWRKVSPACRRQNWVEERTPEFQAPEKKRHFKLSKMTDHKIEKMKER